MSHPTEQKDFCSGKQRFIVDSQLLRVAVLLAIFIGFALRFFRLDIQELSVLEGVAFDFRQHSITYLVQMFLGLDVPLMPGSLWLQDIWHGITGSSVFAIRSISAFCSLLAVPFAYRIARELQLNTFATIVATLLVAISSYAVFHASRVLYHSLSLALTTASIALALRIIRGEGDRQARIAYVICTAASFYTHAFAALALLAQNLYVLFILARDRGAGKKVSTADPAYSLPLTWTVSQIAIGALCVPWLVSVWPMISEFPVRAPSSGLASTLVGGIGRFTVGSTAPEAPWQVGAGLVAIAVIATSLLSPVFGVWREKVRQGKRAKDWTEFEQQEVSNAPVVRPLNRAHSANVLLPLYLLAALLTSWSPDMVYPLFFGSTHALAVPSFLLLLTVGLVKIGDLVETLLGPRWKNWTESENTSLFQALNRIRVGSIATAILLLAIVAGNFFSLHNFHMGPQFSRTRGLTELASMLERLSVGLNPAEVRFSQIFIDPALWNYYYTGGIEYTSLPLWPYDSEAALEIVRNLRESGVHIVFLLINSHEDLAETDMRLHWLADRMETEMPSQGQTRAEITQFARQTLSTSYQLAAQETVGPWLVELYARPAPQQWRLFDEEFANGLTLDRAQVSPNFPPAGGRLVVHMEWSGDPHTLTGGEKIFLHLLDESGNLVAQWDPEFNLDSSNSSVSVGMPIPSTLPAGPLRLIAGLYDVNMEGAPRILTESGQESLLLVYFQVAECDACGR